MTEQEEQTSERTTQATISLPIPAPEPDLFRHKATNGVLQALLDNPYEQFTLRELSRFTDQAVQSVKRAVDVLEANELVVTGTPGNRRFVSINRSRMTKPDDPILQIPQSDFHQPVREALNHIQNELEGIAGALVFGSVARGQADRQSDIDLWVLVEDHGGQQHQANEIAKQLGQKRFDGDRYEFQILVESIKSARGHEERLRDVFSDAITLVDSDEFRSLKREVLSDA